MPFDRQVQAWVVRVPLHKNKKTKCVPCQSLSMSADSIDFSPCTTFQLHTSNSWCVFVHNNQPPNNSQVVHLKISRSWMSIQVERPNFPRIFQPCFLPGLELPTKQRQPMYQTRTMSSNLKDHEGWPKCCRSGVSLSFVQIPTDQSHRVTTKVHIGLHEWHSELHSRVSMFDKYQSRQVQRCFAWTFVKKHGGAKDKSDMF